MSTLSPQTTVNLIDAFEYSGNKILNSVGQTITGIPCRQLSRFFDVPICQSAQNFLSTVGYAGSYESIFEDELVQVEIEEDEEPSRVRYRCPETFRLQYLPLEETSVVQVNPDQFLNYIAELLEIESFQRKGIKSPIIRDYLWKLGSARFYNGFYIPVYFVRSINRDLNKIIDSLAAEKTQMILLTSSSLLPERIKWPDGVVVCILKDAVVQHLPETKLDTEWIYKKSISGGEYSAEMQDDFPVQYDAVRQALSIKGKPDWHIRGAAHAAAVKYMVDQARMGNWELQAKDILVAACTNGKIGRSRTMDSLFTGNREWDQYIEKVDGKHGKYRLKLN